MFISGTPISAAPWSSDIIYPQAIVEELVLFVAQTVFVDEGYEVVAY